MSGDTEVDKGVIYAKGGDHGGGQRYGLYVNENQNPQGRATLIADDNVEKVMVNSSVLVNDGDWHHVAGLRDVNDLRLYVDGLHDGTNNLPAGYDLSGTHQHNAYIGVVTDHEADPNGTVLEKFLRGSVDDVRIYDYALSDPEVLYLAVEGAPSLHIPLISPAELYDGEPNGFKKVNFKDYSIMANTWLEKEVWP